MKRKKIGLLVMAYGTPYQLSDIKQYYTHIRNGREPSAKALEELTDRYKTIGGTSPMARITEEQAKSLQHKLNQMQDEYEFKLYIGLKHINPFIEDAVAAMAKDDITEAVSIVLAPHYSTMSIKSYNGRAQEEANKHGIRMTSVKDWYDAPKFIQYWSEQIGKTYEQMPKEDRDHAVLIVSAHSLPERILEDNDPYPKQLAETADLIAEKIGITDYEVGWQSEGNTPDPWIGPDVLDLTKQLYEKKGYRTFVYAPVGFVSDHLEVLYDNDFECKEVCSELEAKYYRPEMPNTDNLFIEAMAEVILDNLN